MRNKINRDVFKTFETDHSKITVEEIGDRWIATYWDKTDCYEVDREVYEFETSGGALGKAFDLMTELFGP